jgi:hypothetical protein
MKKPRNVLTTYVDPVLNCTVTVYKSTKTPKSKMTGKNSRGFNLGTSGFASSFPRKTAWSK